MDPYELPIDELDGVSGKQLFSKTARGHGFTFDDLILLPGHIDFGVTDVNLGTKLTKNITLKLPIASSPMDTVTEHKMAIAMALEGGIGFIHHNLTIQEQAREVEIVKRFKSGFIFEPYCLSKDATLEDYDRMVTERGFTGVPVTEDGKTHSKLIGMVTSRDTEFVESRTVKLVDVMTTADRLVTLPEGCSLEQANDKLRESKLSKIAVINDDFGLVALVSRKDLLKTRDYPNASNDAETQQLLVGASVGIDDVEASKQRLTALANAGVDVVAFDSKQGDCQEELQLIKWSKEQFPELQIVGGNACTAMQVMHLIKAGVDAVRVGMGVGSVATGQVVKAVGRAQMSAVFNAAWLCNKFGVPVIADGGIKNSGCAIKALSLGANVVMMGSLLAGTEESPGQYYFQDGMRLKKYRGVMSLESMKGLSHDEDRPNFAQGVTGAVVDKGTARKFLPYQAQSIRHGFQDIGVKSVEALHEHLFSGKLRFEVRSAAAQREGGVHDLHHYTA